MSSKQNEAIKKMTSELAHFLEPSALVNSIPPATVYVTLFTDTCKVTDQCTDHGVTPKNEAKSFVYQLKNSFGLPDNEFKDAVQAAFKAVQKLPNFDPARFSFRIK